MAHRIWKGIRKQARHDWEQMKDILDWMYDHTEQCTAAIVGIPILVLALMEAYCYMELWQMNAVLETLLK